MVTQVDDRPIEVLLVEDNPADARLAQDTIEQSSQQANITHAEDGEIALAILRKEGEYSSAPRPDLILLDLRMPRKDGTEVLAEINADEDLVSIPVMLLTGTEAEASLLESYAIPPSPLRAQAATIGAIQQGPRRPRTVQPPAYRDSDRVGNAPGKRRYGTPPMVVAVRLKRHYQSIILNPVPPCDR